LADKPQFIGGPRDGDEVPEHLNRGTGIQEPRLIRPAGFDKDGVPYPPRFRTVHYVRRDDGNYEYRR
jgi:hypothetical protein